MSSQYPPAPQEASARNLAIVVYALQALSVVNGITLFVAVVINYVKLDEVRGTWLESHFRWQIRTFWLSLLWAVLAMAAALVVFAGAFGLSLQTESAALVGGVAGLGIVGFILVPLAILAWFLYRVVKGWLRLNDNQPVS